VDIIGAARIFRCGEALLFLPQNVKTFLVIVFNIHATS